MNADRIVLTGFSGTGKSTVASTLARELGWTAIDTDQDIERWAGKSVPEIFTVEGEARFREIERTVLLQSLDRSNVVIATGGGAVIAEDAWSETVLSRAGTIVITLDADPDVLLERLRIQQSIDGETVERPLLAGSDQYARVIAMMRTRQATYDRADLTIITDRLSSDQVSSAIANLVRPSSAPDVKLDAASGSSDIYVRPGIAAELGSRARQQWPVARRAWVITDANIGRLHADGVKHSLLDASFDVRIVTVPSGETSKSWEVAGNVIGDLLSGGIQRNDLVIALGGGVVGDLAGFAAAVTLRGVGVVQVPTSLLAMVDSSVGGKTGINHPVGKNLIGAFYQPPLVLVDPRFLSTLPARELMQSWAEMVKHAIIQPSTPDPQKDDLIRLMKRNSTALRTVDGLAMTHLIRRNIALKACVVEADERESSLRAILNYGHTIGHAIEAADYRYLHGEAIAVGMHAANRIAQLTGRIDSVRESGLNALITSFGLPATAAFDTGVVRERMKSDKKNTGGKQTWVLPSHEGGVQLIRDIDEAIVDTALTGIHE